MFRFPGGGGAHGHFFVRGRFERASRYVCGGDFKRESEHRHHLGGNNPAEGAEHVQARFLQRERRRDTAVRVQILQLPAATVRGRRRGDSH